MSLFPQSLRDDGDMGPSPICNVCYNVKYECVCPKTVPEPHEEILITLKKREPPAPPPKPISENTMHITDEDKQFIVEYEKRYPQMTSEFKQICAEQFVVFCRKNSNYGCGNIALGSTLIDSADIKLSLTGLWLRMYDKFQRLKSLVVNGQPDAVGETIQETYSDLSNYGIIGQIILRGKWEK